MQLLKADRISIFIQGKPILHEISFSATSGQFVGILGPNGSGKTTLLRGAAGLLPYTGSLQLKGKEIAAWKPPELSKTLSFVRQASNLNFDFQVLDLVLLGRSPHKRWLEGYSASDRSRALDALSQVDLGHFADRSALTLSGGELQRVMLAQALVQDTEVLLLDEPTAHLDIHHSYVFLSLARRLLDHGKTVIAVIHDLEIAARYATDLIILNRGNVHASGKPVEVLTPGLIREVFGMVALVEQNPAGNLRIHYAAPVEAFTLHL